MRKKLSAALALTLAGASLAGLLTGCSVREAAPRASV